METNHPRRLRKRPTAGGKAFATYAIAECKTIADIVQFGDFCRLESPYAGPRVFLWYCRTTAWSEPCPSSGLAAASAASERFSAGSD